MSSTSATDVLARVRAAERRGDYLGAFDLARRGLEEFPGDLKLGHRAVLALARSGATAGARALLDRLGTGDDELIALDARLYKDAALAATGDQRATLAREAAARYAALYAKNGASYPAINAATLHLLAGDRARAAELADRALALTLAEHPGPDPLDAYWREATAAEAALVLGRLDQARTHLEAARRANPDDHAALATTRKQLSLICVASGADLELIEALRPPAVAHYTGHMIGDRFQPSSEARIAAEITAALARRDVGYGFGSLASGADILFAEALLARDAELHVVLPFDAEQFVKTSVARAGEAWVARFHAAIARASSVTYGTLDASTEDTDALYAYGGQLAMGLALLRAGFLATHAVQLAVWDGKPARGPAGTAADVATWSKRRLVTEVIAIEDGADLPDGAPIAKPVSPMHVKAILFGDIKGFSKLRERDVPKFVDYVLGACGRVLDECDVDIRNTWGDGLYLVLPSAGAAAHCASKLQATIRSLDPAAIGPMGLRLAGHVGPVFDCFDAVTKQRSFFGSHVTRTARIEPVTPEGEVFVTEPFAAALALGAEDFACDYVGDVPAAKGFGNLRMCVLKQRTER
jgi:tetratricopeptide (TPR) repeat protein